MGNSKTNKKAIREFEKLSGQSGIKSGKNIIYSTNSRFYDPSKRLRDIVKDKLEVAMNSSEVRHIDFSDRAPEVICDLALRRIIVVKKIKKNSRLRANPFLRNLLRQKYPLTLGQVEKAEQVICAINARLTKIIEQAG